MTDSGGKKTYTFLMPGEERIFFDHFHTIAIALFLIFSSLGVFVSEMTVAEAMLRGLVFVSPIYVVYLVYAKRFADVVTLDFDARKVRFKFQFYLTFVMDDARIMVKRPKNKKEIFVMLNSVFTVNRGIFGGL
ncbi:MAG: hypothetical protein JRJ79_08075 [Deltaproteobacteria bacterium]|nr:hypothetical protein [Deltaproteobacteria bacterium]